MTSRRVANAAALVLCTTALVCTWGPSLLAQGYQPNAKCVVEKEWDDATCTYKNKCCDGACGTFTGAPCIDCCASDMKLGDCVYKKRCESSPNETCEDPDLPTVCFRWIQLTSSPGGGISGSPYCNCTPDPANNPCSPDCAVEAEAESSGYSMVNQCSGTGS